MVTLNRIYTRSGDAGATRLATGAQVSKADLRVEAYGAVDETNACLGLARLHTAGDLDAILARIQNELFDLGADLSTPAKADEPDGSMLRILDSQVARLESEIDELNAELPPLTSFILPGGTPAAAALHPGPHRLPPRRTLGRPAGGGRRAGQRPGDELPEPAVGPAVRRGPLRQRQAARPEVFLASPARRARSGRSASEKQLGLPPVSSRFSRNAKDRDPFASKSQDARRLGPLPPHRR